MNSIYVTFDRVTQETGAGKVCMHEIEALKRVTDLEQVITREDVASRIEKYYGFNPFFYDYFASDLAEEAELAHLSCSPAMALLRKIRPEKSLMNLVAHDLKTSVEEHERIMGTPYPYPHNVDPYLFKCLLRHAEKVDVVVTPSEGSAKWIGENLDVKRVEVIPHGTDVPVNVKPIPREFKPGYLGVWGPDKGLIYLLMAWNHLEYAGIDFQLGGDCGEPLKQIVPRLSNSRATYGVLGRVPDLGDFYNSLSVYVQPCYSEDTRILTKNGLKEYSDLQINDEVWTLNCKGELELNLVNETYCSLYKGQMVKMENKQVNLLITPNHRVYYHTVKDRENFQVRPAKDFLGGNTRYFLPTTGKWKGIHNEWIETDLLFAQKRLTYRDCNKNQYQLWKRAMDLRAKGFGGRIISREIGVPEPTVNGWIYRDAKPWGHFKLLPNKISTATLLEIMGWYIAEGSIRCSDSVIENLVCISNRNKKNQERIIHLFKEFGLKPSLSNNSDVVTHCIPLAQILKKCGKGSLNKTIPNWCLDFSSELLHNLYNGLMSGDGSRRGHHVTYYTSSDKLKDKFIELCLKLGFSTNTERRKCKSHKLKVTGQIIPESEGWVISIREKYNKGSIKSANITFTPYNGIVWCVGTKNNNLFVERQGRITLCGNSVTEGFGLPVLEAMSYGRPVIVTEGVGSSYLVEDGKEGFVVPVRSPKALAEKLRYFEENRKEIKRMGARAKKKAKKFSWAKIEERYCRLYESL